MSKCLDCYENHNRILNGKNECICKNGFQENSLKEPICIPESIKNCKVQPTQSNKCEECEDPYYLSSDQLLCDLKCVNDQEASVINNIKICTQKIDNNIYIEVRQENDNQIILKFNSKKQFDINLIKNNIQFNIPDLKDMFTQDSIIISPQEIQINVKVKMQINEKKSSIIKLNKSDQLQFSQDEKYISMNIVNQLEGKEKQASAAIQGISQSVSTVAQTSIIPLYLTGNFQIIASLLDITQLIYIMYFAQVKYVSLLFILYQPKYSFLINNYSIPINVQNFYEGLEAFKIPFFNFFEEIQEKKQIMYDSPIKFKQQGIQGFFLSNFGDNLSYTITIVLIHLFYKYVISKIFKKYEKSLTKFSQFILNPKFYLDILWGLYLELAVAVFLQVQVIQKAVYFEEGINYTFFFIGFFVLFSPGVLFLMILLKKYDWIISLLNEEMNSKFYSLVLYARKVYIALVVTLVQDSALTQIILISIWHIITIFYVILCKPYKSKYKNIKHLNEAIFFSVSTLLLIKFYQHDPQSDNHSVDFGWIVISSYGVIVLVDFIYFVRQSVRLIIKNFKKLVESLRYLKKCYQERQQEKIEQIKMSEGHVDIPKVEIKQEPVKPEVKINGRRASPVKTINYKPFSHITIRATNTESCSYISPLTNKQFNTDCGSDQNSPSLFSTGIKLQLQLSNTNRYINQQQGEYNENYDEIQEEVKIPSSQQSQFYFSSNILSDRQLKASQYSLIAKQRDINSVSNKSDDSHIFNFNLNTKTNNQTTSQNIQYN